MTSPIDRFIDQADTRQALQVHAARLTRLEVLLQDCLPPNLSATCHVANLRQEELVVHADSGAAAAKLNQLLPSVLGALQQRGALVASIKVRVRPVEYRPAPPPPTERVVSPATRACMDELAASLPADSPLTRALQRFVRRSA